MDRSARTQEENRTLGTQAGRKKVGKQTKTGRETTKDTSEYNYKIKSKTQTEINTFKIIDTCECVCEYQHANTMVNILPADDQPVSSVA